MPPETPQKNAESQKKFSNSKIVEIFEAKPWQATVWDIALGLNVKSIKLQELLRATHFSWIYQKNTKGITELKDPKWFFFSEPRNDDIYTLNHTDQGYTLHRIREGKEFFMMLSSEYINLHDIDHTWDRLAQLSKDLKDKWSLPVPKTTVK